MPGAELHHYAGRGLRSQEVAHGKSRASPSPRQTASPHPDGSGLSGPHHYATSNPLGPINIPASRAVRAPAVCHGQEPDPNRSLSPLAAGRLCTWGSSSFADAGCDNAAPAPRSLPASRAGCPAPGVAIRGCPDDRDGAGGERSDIDGIGRGLVVGRAGVATLTRFGVPVAWFRVCPPGLRLGLTLVPTVS